ncbi:site-2 protease family protein [Cesiribacter sp. SM1]|uniref:site-2 protease family protein n=1 Tax=Cesiribacter sp. SM1 TaxID=2861196 RepID=UPI001CD6B2A4|nr:site-2 protease family protein [Cesiribacter sp. SM1]
MKRQLSLYIGRFAGIKVYIHWTFWIILVWVFYMYYNINQDAGEGLKGVLFILALFACVVLHEYGHALTARKYHINTRRITLYPIGGIASLEAMPEKPGQELMVAAAGPLVNVVIAAILWAYLQFSGQMPDFASLQNADPADLQQIDLPFAFNLLVANIILVVFNLIPAFPLDGGRMLRASLAFGMDRTRATRIAATIGQLLAVAFVFFGFFFNFWLVIIGFFVYLGAGSEAKYESIRTGLSDYRVEDVVMRKFSLLSPEDTLDKAVQLLLNSQEHDFIVAAEDRVVGVLTRKELIKGLSENGKTAPVSQAMSQDYIVLHPNMPLQEVYHKMMTGASTVNPVIENGRFIGIVNKTNIDELLMVDSALRQS